MHEYDPNGSLRKYRIQRQRRECYHAILFAIGFLCAISLAGLTYLLVTRHFLK